MGDLSNETLIYHIFADVGVESEPLSAYGRVVRVGLDPIDTNESEPVRGDATELPLRSGADLAVLHPPCQAHTSLTSAQGSREDHDNLIPEARSLGKEVADDYIIENVPGAPLRGAVELEGRMFGLPITYKRSFETSFHVRQPGAYDSLLADDGPFADHSQTGGWQGTEQQWRSVKQVSGDYPAKELKRSGIPAPYIHHLMRNWLRSRAE